MAGGVRSCRGPHGEDLGKQEHCSGSWVWDYLYILYRSNLLYSKLRASLFPNIHGGQIQILYVGRSMQTLELLEDSLYLLLRFRHPAGCRRALEELARLRVREELLQEVAIKEPDGLVCVSVARTASVCRCAPPAGRSGLIQALSDGSVTRTHLA